MTVLQYSDYSSSIRYVLTSEICGTAMVEIALDLYRGSSPASRTILARVARRDERTVLIRCRRHLERQGVHAVANAPLPEVDRDERPDPHAILPVAAFDWMFEAG